jgi:hypothetical protein
VCDNSEKIAPQRHNFAKITNDETGIETRKGRDGKGGRIGER